jgi:hypothetical protein
MIYIGLVHDKILPLAFMIDKAHGWRDIPKMWGHTWLLPRPRPLFFENAPHPRALPYTYDLCKDQSIGPYKFVSFM